MTSNTSQDIFNFAAATCPSYARLPINRCNIPPVILGSVTFQERPSAVYLDSQHLLHKALFLNLDEISEPSDRLTHFMDYMKSAFLLDRLDEAGLNSQRNNRAKADYLRVLRGWMFDTDSKEGAVLKGWVESRFGLLTLNHLGSLLDRTSHAYQLFLAMRSQGFYNTNALESQLDLVFTYCQYELKRQKPDQEHVTLYRGVNHISEHDIIERNNARQLTVLLNNINSFTSNSDYACTFGDTIIEVSIPLSKLFYFPNLFPGTLQGEEEYIVIGGAYRVSIYPR